MDPRAYVEMRELEDHHWWFAGRRRVAERLVREALGDAPRPRVLEVGCGTGGNLAWLAELAPGARAVGVDRDAAALALCRGRGLPGTALARADGLALPVPDGSVDAVLALDVIEHFDDDAALVAELTRVLRPGGQLVASVPAYPWLWSPHDEFLHHRRRYRGGQLEALLVDAGLEVERAHGFNFALLPAVAGVRLAKRALARGRPAAGTDFSTPPAPIDRALRAVFAAEAAVLRVVRVPVGVSFMVRAARPTG